jgi:predicted nucleic acid-binding protein
MAERGRRVSAERCAELPDLLCALPVERDEETTRVSGAAFRLARTNQLTVYDAIYLDLAARREIVLGTRGQELRRMQ